MNDARTAIAIHEAGHAVMMALLRLPFKSVTIKPKPNALGRVTIGCRGTTIGRAYRVEHYVKALMAGPLGQALAGQHEQERDGFGYDGNVEQIEILYEFLHKTVPGCPDWDTWIKKLLDETKDTLGNPNVWDAVQRVASLLMDSEVAISSELVRKALKSALL